MAADGCVRGYVEEVRHHRRRSDVGANIDSACFEKQKGKQDQNERSDREALDEGLHIYFSDALAGWTVGGRFRECATAQGMPVIRVRRQDRVSEWSLDPRGRRWSRSCCRQR